jgi:N-acetylglucosaminyl-diphospho-decaprenol L-rhamnosyltransferase
MRNIYTIIVTYNGLKWIEPCLNSLQSSTCPVHTIVVDNDSTDGTPKKIKEEYPDVLLIESPENLGFGAANNIGIKKALEKGADYIFLLNQDAWVERDTIQTLLDIAEKHPSYGIVSPMHMNGSGTGLDYQFSTYIEPQKCPDLVSDLYMNQTGEIYPLYNVNAAAWFLPGKMFETVGYFDQLFFMYGEDGNYVDRTKYHGYKIGVTPKTNIYHDRENRTSDKEKIMNSAFLINRMKVISLNPNDSISEKLFLLFRKSMSSAMQSFRQKEISLLFLNVSLFFRGIYFSFKYRNRYMKPKQSA